jgi:serine/threonine-protein kinase
VLEVGTIVAGKLRIERILGEGGMGIVAAATHLQLDQHVAIKIMRREVANDPDTAERFLREARASAKLKNEHVCKVSDVGTLDTGEPYLVMELLDGEDLAHVIDRAPLPPATAAGYVLQACIAIAEAHAQGIVHRDLKPANLFVTHRVDGQALIKVLDFGIAKAPVATDVRLTKTAMMMGSPAYMSPEQLRSAHDVDGRTDIWSLGVILYEAVSGRLPFEATSVTELAVKVAVDLPAPLTGVDPAYAAVVMRCLEKHPDARYQTVGELAAALAPLGGEDSQAAAMMIARMSGSRTAPPTAQRSTPALATTASATPRRRWPLAVLGALLAAGAGAAAFIATRTHERTAKHVDAGVVATIVPDASPPPDAAETHEVRDMLKDLSDDKEYDAILRLAPRAKGDTEAEAIVADARAKYVAAQLAAIEGENKVGACTKSKQLATEAAELVPDEPSLAAAAGKCKVRVNEPPETPQALMTKAGDAFGKKDYAQALALALKVLDRDKGNKGALRLATLSTCSLHDAKKARVFYLQLDQTDRNYALYWCRKEGIEPTGEPETPAGPPPAVNDGIAKAGAAFARGDLASAQRTIDEVLKTAPRNAAALTIAGLIACRNHDEAKARAILERIGPRKRKALLAGCERAGTPL